MEKVGLISLEDVYIIPEVNIIRMQERVGITMNVMQILKKHKDVITYLFLAFVRPL